MPIEAKYLAPKHTNMRVSMDGVLGRIADGQRPNKCQRFMVEEILKHLKLMAHEFYDGKIFIVDEFCQLYCLDDNRPDNRRRNPGVDAPRSATEPARQVTGK